MRNGEYVRMRRARNGWMERADTYKAERDEARAERDALARRIDAVRAYAERLAPGRDDLHHHLHPSEVLDDVIHLLDGGDIDALNWSQDGEATP